MGRIDRLIQSYTRHISLPWRNDAAAAQRVIFCIYNENEERPLRAKIDEFEIATRQAGHSWIKHDLTDSFAAWLSNQRYAETYFKNPKLLETLYPKYLEYLIGGLSHTLEENKAGEDTVVAVTGVAELFGLLKVKELVDRFAPMVEGRLLIFFPGSFENNNYRLLDGYDGWNYLAVPVTAEE